MGDVHGHLEELTRLLQSVDLIDGNMAWSGEADQLWLLGDLFDRGPDGIGVVDLIMRLESESEKIGGSVQCLLGNHELIILAAHRFSGRPNWGSHFVDIWLRNGGEPRDLASLRSTHLEWLVRRPAAGVLHLPGRGSEGPILLLHADSDMYLRFGSSIREINMAMMDELKSDEGQVWQRLLVQFSDRHRFDGSNWGGMERARRFLSIVGARRLIHGHTPISKVTGQPDDEVYEPLVYADGLCVNVDPGLYRGGRGFIYQVGQPD